MARPRILIVGAGFAGFHAARELCRLSRGRADVAIVNPTDYFLHLPLLPEVAAGLLDPRDITVSLPATLPSVRLVLAEASHIDFGVPGYPEVYACGDAAAAPDLTRPGEVTAMTAQHAARQGRQVARNIAAEYGTGRRRPYKHHDLGFVVDLGGTKAAANPLRIPLHGLPAKTVTRGYHLLSLPGKRIRTATEWLLDALLPRQTLQLGLVRSPAVPLNTARPELPTEPVGRFRAEGS